MVADQQIVSRSQIASFHLIRLGMIHELSDYDYHRHNRGALPRPLADDPHKEQLLVTCFKPCRANTQGHAASKTFQLDIFTAYLACQIGQIVALINCDQHKTAIHKTGKKVTG